MSKMVRILYVLSPCGTDPMARVARILRCEKRNVALILWPVSRSNVLQSRPVPIIASRKSKSQLRPWVLSLYKFKYAFLTRSETDIPKWRKYGKKFVKNSPNRRCLCYKTSFVPMWLNTSFCLPCPDCVLNCLFTETILDARIATVMIRE